MEGVQQPLSFPDPTEKSGMSFFPRDGLTDNRRDACPPLCLTQGWFLGQGRAAVTITGHECMKEQISHCTWRRWESASVVTTGKY